MGLTMLNVASPLAPVSPDTAAGRPPDGGGPALVRVTGVGGPGGSPAPLADRRDPQARPRLRGRSPVARRHEDPRKRRSASSQFSTSVPSGLPRESQIS